MSQFHTEWSHFWRQMVTIDYDGVSTHLMIILMIEVGIQVILACPNFIRPFFDSCWLLQKMWQFHTEWSHFWRLMVTIDYDGFSTKLMIILMIDLGIWVIRASGNFIRRGPTFGGKWLLQIMMNWHPEALSIITRLGRQLARNVGKLDEEVIRHLRQRLGVMLVRDNVAMLCARTPTFPPAEVD